jgi:ornithine carbamoyltransferase
MTALPDWPSSCALRTFRTAPAPAQGSGGREQGTAEVIAFPDPYQVSETLMEKAAKDAIFMHCVPAYRGREVTDGVIDGPHSVVISEAENRLHVRRAILAWCLEKV